MVECSEGAENEGRAIRFAGPWRRCSGVGYDPVLERLGNGRSAVSVAYYEWCKRSRERKTRVKMKIRVEKERVWGWQMRQSEVRVDSRRCAEETHAHFIWLLSLPLGHCRFFRSLTQRTVKAQKRRKFSSLSSRLNSSLLSTDAREVRASLHKTRRRKIRFTAPARADSQTSAAFFTSSMGSHGLVSYLLLSYAHRRTHMAPFGVKGA